MLQPSWLLQTLIQLLLAVTGSDNQLEYITVICETMENDSQESKSIVVEDTDWLEPQLLLEVHSNSGDEGNCVVDVPTSTPNPQVSFTGSSHEQPYGRSVGADQCNENCILTDVKPVAEKPALVFKYKFSGKCYRRIRRSTGRGKLGVSGWALRGLHKMTKGGSVPPMLWIHGSCNILQ